SDRSMSHSSSEKSSFVTNGSSLFSDLSTSNSLSMSSCLLIGCSFHDANRPLTLLYSPSVFSCQPAGSAAIISYGLRPCNNHLEVLAVPGAWRLSPVTRARGYYFMRISRHPPSSFHKVAVFRSVHRR